jgi:hypothetical protein
MSINNNNGAVSLAGAPKAFQIYEILNKIQSVINNESTLPRNLFILLL